jgi:hypothetical protein
MNILKLMLITLTIEALVFGLIGLTIFRPKESKEPRKGKRNDRP